MVKFHKNVIEVVLLISIGLANPFGADGFAYAPNFITKIISETTGKEPVGLLDIPSKSENVEVDGESSQNDNNNDEKEGTSSVVLDGPITTRFPPEPNGYLHLGHAKAVSFNFQVARMFPPTGRCNMRLDDTNPSKENQEYIDSILEDVRWIQSGKDPFPDSPVDDERAENNGPWFGKVHKTSDNFQLIYDCARELIKSGDAYVDSLSADEMREMRGSLTEPGTNSPFRDRSAEENLDLFEKMRAGEIKEGVHIVRAKIDMASSNINMRDPALYRIKHESHPSTGNEWCIYPMYDFSHPIQDSSEGITHSLCTLEFEDHRPFYDWTLEKLMPSGLITHRPRQIEFSRLNLKYTVLSKRKLIQLVEGNHVHGWDDPRMPTLSGIRRRGSPPEAMRLFCERVGISKVDSFIDVGDLENCIREIMDDTSERAFAILKPLKVTITNWEGPEIKECFEVPRHPKKEKLGYRTVPFGKEVYIERSDFFDLEGPEGEANDGRKPKGFKRLLPDGMVRLKYAYVISCEEIIRDPDSREPIELKCKVYPETRAGVTPEGMNRVKGIIQWVEASTAITCQINQYDRLFKTEEPGKATGDFLDDLNPDSLEKLEGCLVEPSVAIDTADLIAKIDQHDKESSNTSNDKIYHSELAYQFERSGYFALDTSSSPGSTVFNRVVTLRDTWAVPEKKKGGKNNANQRKRGGNAPNKSNNGAVLEDVRRVAIRAGTILEAGPHPDADSLIVCKVDCGDEGGELRTVVAGLGGKIPFDDLLNKKVACVTNLKPAKMRGIASSAMLLAASDGSEGVVEKVELLNIPNDVANGELISFDGKEPCEPDEMMKSKGAIKAFERVKACLKVGTSGEALYVNDGKEHKMVSSGGAVTVNSLTEVIIQ
uniref:glutamine--tRNA ligase n=2 Tax=Chaetoceros debilis TaxID=122233 RepID=A0A7S3V563_9STRA|mmetsp:Transcript_30142/g.46114  ORF Transcript_30142/g.46114 Transcript_30142/m.46114 type:complete len:883 (+) Transcript_30142:159-2807(+)